MKILDRQDDITAYCTRLVKLRKTMLENNSPRNSPPETHPDDERGRSDSITGHYCLKERVGRARR